MRLAALVLATLFLAAPSGAATAAAQPAAQEAAETGPSAAEPSKGADRWGDGRVAVDPRDQPAHGTAYNWRQMTFGAAVMLLMLGVLLWIIRRQTRSRRR